MSKVTALRTEEPEVETAEEAHGSGPPSAAPAPAIGYSLVCNLDGNRQITVQCFVGADEPDAVVNSQIDRVFRVVDRQRAKYEIKDLQKQLRMHEEALEKSTIDLAHIEARFAGDQAKLEVQIGEFENAKAEIEKAFYSTRHASTKMTGGDASRVRACDAGIKDAKAQMQKNENERAVALEDFGRQKARFQMEIESIRAEIAEKEDLLKG